MSKVYGIKIGKVVFTAEYCRKKVKTTINNNLYFYTIENKKNKRYFLMFESCKDFAWTKVPFSKKGWKACYGDPRKYKLYIEGSVDEVLSSLEQMKEITLNYHNLDAIEKVLMVRRL